MKWANFLHIYQPSDQQPDILQSIVDQSYRPILTHLMNNPNVRVTLNVNGALLELFDKYGHRDLIDMLRQGGEVGKIEFTGCGKYHAFLPLLEEKDISNTGRVWLVGLIVVIIGVAGIYLVGNAAYSDSLAGYIGMTPPTRNEAGMIEPRGGIVGAPFALLILIGAMLI